jgi:hypothetical protein
MKRQLCGWAPAALLLAAVVPGCSENNEASVLSNQGTTQVKGDSEAPPRTQADFAKRQQEQRKYGGGYPGAGKGAAASSGSPAPAAIK